MGYHKRKIKKGKVGEFSKIQEEFEELADAIEQENPVLQLVELTDILGAIDSYSKKMYNIGLSDLVKMTKCTQSSFKDGSRK